MPLERSSRRFWWAGLALSPCRTLHRVGFTWLPALPGAPVRSYRTLSPLPGRCRVVCFLLHLPSPYAPSR